jgi:predicted RNA-binding Zn ribbon-like protein
MKQAAAAFGLTLATGLATAQSSAPSTRSTHIYNTDFQKSSATGDRTARPQGRRSQRNHRHLRHRLTRANALSSRQVTEALSRFSSAALDRIAREAIALREWFRGVISRIKTEGAKALSSRDVRRPNAVLAQASSYAQIETSPKGGRLRLVIEQSWRTPDELLVPVAVAMAELLCEADLDLVRKCENPICTIWFDDRKAIAGAGAARPCAATAPGSPGLMGTARTITKRIQARTWSAHRCNSSCAVFR